MKKLYSGRIQFYLFASIVSRIGSLQILIRFRCTRSDTRNGLKPLVCARLLNRTPANTTLQDTLTTLVVWCQSVAVNNID